MKSYLFKINYFDLNITSWDLQDDVQLIFLKPNIIYI